MRAAFLFLAIWLCTPLQQHAQNLDKRKTTTSTIANDNTKCDDARLATVIFKKYSRKLNGPAKRILNTAASTISLNSGCNVMVYGYANDECDACKTLSEDRCKAIFFYLTKKGVSPNRLFKITSPEGNFNFALLELRSPGNTPPIQ